MREVAYRLEFHQRKSELPEWAFSRRRTLKMDVPGVSEAIGVNPGVRSILHNPVGIRSIPRMNRHLAEHPRRSVVSCRDRQSTRGERGDVVGRCHGRLWNTFPKQEPVCFIGCRSVRATEDGNIEAGQRLVLPPIRSEPFRVLDRSLKSRPKNVRPFEGNVLNDCRGNNDPRRIGALAGNRRTRIRG